MPGKSLSQLLYEYASRPDADRRGRNRATYLENRDEILAALADGWSMRRIWEVLKENHRIDFSYSVLVHYTRKDRPATTAQNPGNSQKNTHDPEGATI